MSRFGEDDDVDMKTSVKVEQKRKELFDDAHDVEEKDPAKAIQLYRDLISKEDSKEELSATQEEAILKLGALYGKLNKTEELKNLIEEVRPFFSRVSKARGAKIVRSLIDQVPASNLALQAEICEQAVEWCIQEKRSFVKQRIQARLAHTYSLLGRYKDGLALIGKLVKEVKKFDDKQLLVEVELVESRIHHALQNLPKAKGALTAARSAANSIYCPPLLQAQIDTQAGILCADEKDYKTAFSYFYEAFEGYNSLVNPEYPLDALACLKYMLLAKVMTGNPEDVYAIVNGKAGLKYAGPEVEAMRAVADAYKKRSIHEFDRIWAKYPKQLAEDKVVSAHLDTLKANLLEQNLLKLIEPFSRVQIAHVAKLIDLPQPFIEAKLSEMVLDKKLQGILDQGAGDLILYENTTTDNTYPAALDTVKELGNVVDRLYVKAKKLSVQ